MFNQRKGEHLCYRLDAIGAGSHDTETFLIASPEWIGVERHKILRELLAVRHFTRYDLLALLFLGQQLPNAPKLLHQLLCRSAIPTANCASCVRTYFVAHFRNSHQNLSAIIRRIFFGMIQLWPCFCSCTAINKSSLEKRMSLSRASSQYISINALLLGVVSKRLSRLGSFMTISPN